METIINLMKFWESNDIFCKEQHGFTRGRSCLTNLLETLENWTRALDEGYGLDVVYLDYRKAFDSVPHQRLLEKNEWLRNYREVTAVAGEFPHSQNCAGWTKRSSLIHTDGPEWSSARKRIRPTTVLDVCK